MDKHGRPKSGYEQVKDTLERIHLTDARAEVAKSHVRSNFRSDLSGALMFLSREFAEMFPDATFQPNDRRRRHISATDDGKRQRLDDGDEPKTINGVVTYNGVNVTDPGTTISPEDMTRLGPRGQAYLFQERNRLGLTRGRGRGYQGRGRGRGRGYQGRGRGYYGGDERGVSALATSDATIASEVTTATATTNLPLPPPSIGITPPATGQRGSQNGSRFGAGQHLG